MADIKASLILDTKKAEKGVNKVSTALKALASVAVIKATLDLATSFQTINNRLLGVTKTTEEYTKAQENVKNIAASTRSSLGATASLYASLTIASEDLNLKTSQVATITEVFSKTLKISGAETGAAAGAMTQFGQALASGVLRGDEFNSINETNTVFMGKFADILGVTRGELRKLAEEGALTADLMAQATQIMASDVEDDFAKTSATIGEAFQGIQSSIIGLFGKFNQETGAFDSLSAALLSVADAINNIETPSLISFFKDLLYYATALFAIFGVGKLIKGITAFQGGMITLGNSVKTTMGEFRAGNKITKNFGESMAGFRNVFGKGGADSAGGRIGALGTGISGLGRVFVRFLPYIGAAMLAFDAFNFVLKKFTGGKGVGDFLKGPATAISDFVKDLVGMETSTEKATRVLEEELAKQEAALLKAESDKKKAADRDLAIEKLREETELQRQKAREEKQAKADEARAAKALAKLIADNNQRSEEKLLTEAEALKQKLAEVNLEKELLLLGKDEAENKKLLADLENARADAIAELGGKKYAEDEAASAAILAGKIAEINKLYGEQVGLILSAQMGLQDLSKEFSTGITQGFNAFVEQVADQAAYATKLFDTVTQGWSDAFVKFAETGKLSFKDLFRSLMTEIIKMQANKMFLALFGGGGSVFGSLFAGLFDKGGTIPAGKFGIAGENGPEIVNGPASIMSTADTASYMGGGGTTVNYTINAVDSQSFEMALARDPSFVFAVTEAGRRKLPGRA